MYDAADRRFVANDPIRGGVTNPLTLNRYAYVIDNPLRWVDPWGYSYTEANLKLDLDTLVKQHMSAIKNGSTLVHNSTKTTVDIIIKYDVYISTSSATYGIDKAIMQAVLFREIRWVDPSDDVADSFVVSTKIYYDELEYYNKQSLIRQIIIGIIGGTPKAPLRFSDDSSTGLGQIFAKTAIESYNYYFEQIGCDIRYNFDDRNERYDIWSKLKWDDQFNIDSVGVVLYNYSNAELKGGLTSTASSDDIKKVIARYNGFGDAAKRYGNETYEYYLLFKKYNDNN
jgi:hypothetical protein